jgi:RNase H-like domain found in reverse transcriptase
VDFKNNNQLLPLKFYSHILPRSEANYSAIELEFYGVIPLLEALKLTLLGAQIETHELVDHFKLVEL